MEKLEFPDRKVSVFDSALSSGPATLLKESQSMKLIL